SAENVSASTSPGIRGITATNLPVFVSHSRTTLPPPPVASSLPSGDSAAQMTNSLRAGVVTFFFDATSQISAYWYSLRGSWSNVATVPPSALMTSWLPDCANTTAPLPPATSQTLTS